MTELILHPKTSQHIDKFVNFPSHALLISGPAGIGKASLAKGLAVQLLRIERGTIDTYPHYHHISSPDRKAIGIEAVRELGHFLSLKIPGKQEILRAAIIEDAHLLTVEAQNALLKNLEEPPTDTVLILTSSQTNGLLPTIRSRVQTLPVQKPNAKDLEKYFISSNDLQEIKQALTISGGLPGLTASILGGGEDQPLAEAVQIARKLLQSSVYERLLMVDTLAKRKELCRDICFIFIQMAQVSLSRESSTTKRWRAVLTAAYNAEEQLIRNSQIKLVLTNLMLSL